MAPTLVAHGPDADPQHLPPGPEGLGLSACEPQQLMEALAERGCNQVLWECGPELAAAAIQTLVERLPERLRAVGVNVGAGVLGVLPGVIGVLQAVEAIKLIVGLGSSLKGRLLCYDALENHFEEIRVPRDPQCRVCADDVAWPGYEEHDPACS